MRFPPSLPSSRPFDVVGLGGNAADTIVTIPRFPEPGEKVSFSRWSRQGGGRTATAMVTVSRLGGRSRYMGGVGDDDDGRANVRALQDEGVDVEGVLVRPHAFTQRAFILVHEETGERTIVWGRGPGIPLEPEEVIPEMIVSGRLFYTDAQNPHSAARAAAIARESGMPVLADLEAVRPGHDAFLPMVDLLVSDARFPSIATGVDDLPRAMEMLEDRSGGALVIVTQGPRGAIARIDGRVEAFPGYAVEAVDTTGSGDVFHGAFAWTILRGMELREAIDFSNAVAAMKCRRLGGREGIPRGAEEVNRFRRETPHLV
jgi:sugar/nucleoside kinase (ribokinase family)